MSAALVVVIVVVVVVLLVGAAALLSRRAAGRRRLRERFGPEYERTVQTSGGSREAEAQLRARVERRDQLAIRPLTRTQRDRYEQDWRQVQAEFVDVPARSLSRADSLLTDVMVDRGYPMQDFDGQADLISVDHPEVVQHYRRAHSIYTESQAGQASTEDLRQAFVSYRALFENLTADEAPATGTNFAAD